MGNITRFANHSCNPNCESQRWVVDGVTRVGLYALDDIKADTELTFSYNFVCDFEGLDNDGTTVACQCDGRDCTGIFKQG